MSWSAVLKRNFVTNKRVSQHEASFCWALLENWILILLDQLDSEPVLDLQDGFSASQERFVVDFNNDRVPSVVAGDCRYRLGEVEVVVVGQLVQNLILVLYFYLLLIFYRRSVEGLARPLPTARSFSSKIFDIVKEFVRAEEAHVPV